MAWSACGSPPGPLQGAKATASKRHSKLEPVSLEENPKVGVESLVVPEGPEVIVVSGAAESSTSVSGAEQEEVLPDAVAVARSSVLELSGTVTVIPASSLAAVPVASGVPVQAEVE